jgi:hypothetical protein
MAFDRDDITAGGSSSPPTPPTGTPPPSSSGSTPTDRTGEAWKARLDRFSVDCTEDGPAGFGFAIGMPPGHEEEESEDGSHP